MPQAHLTFLPRSAQPVMPWRNGGGSTREVARALADDDPDGFRWRVSVARIERDGPFSPFPGVDRTLWLLGGAGMDLAIDGAPTQLTTPLASVSFAGEATVSARLLGGPTDDLNLMVHRATGRATPTVRRLAAPWTWEPGEAGTDLILVLEGAIELSSATGARAHLEAGDAARVDGAEGRRRWMLTSSAPAAVFVATLA